jgi:FixJ family two-component response regulator
MTSRREAEVLDLLARGEMDKEIAKDLGNQLCCTGGSTVAEQRI